MKNKEHIANLIKRVSTELSYERGAVCAVDCLLQWELGLLNETIIAWERHLIEAKNVEGYSSCFRHGAWVPAIPLQ